MKRMNKKAFTLIELLVVIAVIGILVLLGTSRFTGYTQKAELTRIQHDIKVMEQEVGTVLSTDYDDFNKWENNIKDLNQLVQNNELFEKGGPVVDPIDGTYKVIPEEYKDKINTKLKGTFYANIGGKIYYEHGKGPGYSDEEIDDLKNKGFIPVATAEELDSIRYETTRTYGEGTEWEGQYLGGLDKKYVQVKNIDLSEYSKEVWTPIGTLGANFTGIYDGGNYVIRGLEVKGEEKSYQGLFGRTYRATIRNVGLENVNITGAEYVGGLVGYAGNFTNITNSYATGSVTGNRYVGGLVGWANWSTIENSYSEGPVKGRGNSVGGLVGYALRSTISSSYSTGPVKGTGNYYVGGLVGTANQGTISNSYATGSVTGTGSSVGGLVGNAVNSGTTISNSYATGSVTGKNSVGGLAGHAGNSSSISNSYATGSVTGTGDHVGGLVGRADDITIENSYATGPVTGTGSGTNVGGLVGWAINNTEISNSYATGKVKSSGTNVGGLVGWVESSTVTNSYWDKETTDKEESAGGVGMSTDEMKIRDTYSDWNFENVWKIDEGNDYPKLR